MGSAETLTALHGLLLLNRRKDRLGQLVRTFRGIRRVQNLIEVLEGVHIQLNDVRRLVVNAYSAVLNVLSSVSSVVRLRLSYCSLPGLR